MNQSSKLVDLGPLDRPRRRLLRAIPGVAMLPLLGACSSILPGQGPAGDLYRLTPKSTFPDEMPRVDWQLVIETPASDASLNTTRIALLHSPTKVEYFASAGWVDRAPAMIQTLMIESFENSDRIIAVGRENIGLRSDFVLKVDLREFQAIYYDGSPPRVVITLILKLVEMPRRAIIGSERITADMTATGEGMSEIIRAFDKALGKVLKRAVFWTLKTGENQWAQRRA